MDQQKQLENLLSIFLIKYNKRKIIKKLLFIRIMADIGIFQNKKTLELFKALFLGNSLLPKLLMMFKILLIVKVGIKKWEFHTKEVIFYMVLLELVKVHLLKL